MWYRNGISKENSERVSQGWNHPLHKSKKQKKHKVKNFADEIEPVNIPAFNEMAPINITPPVDVTPPTPKANIPEELQDLYGPDHNLRDDKIINTPDDISDIQDIKNETNDIESPENISPMPSEEDIPNEEPIPLVENEEDENQNIDEEDDTLDESKNLISPIPEPPVHEFCHCEVITMPGGRKIWRASPNACQQCLDARDAYNDWQNNTFGS